MLGCGVAMPGDAVRQADKAQHPHPATVDWSALHRLIIASPDARALPGDKRLTFREILRRLNHFSPASESVGQR